MFLLRASRFLPLVIVCGACGSPPPAAGDDAAPTSSVEQAIIGGSASVPAQNAVVLIVRPLHGGVEACSGTMLTPRLVLTARHCVASATQTLDCSPAGVASQAALHDFDPTSYSVYGGLNRPDLDPKSATPSTGAKIVDDGAATLCNHDIALVVLATPVAGASIAPIRLDALPNVGEAVTLVGWGLTDTSSLPSVRQQRDGVKVLGKGPNGGVGAAEFFVGEGACEGDSGGPAFAASGAVVGSSSRGGNDSNATGAAGCKNGLNIYTSPAGFKQLVLSAYALAGQEPWLEGQPNPLLAKENATCGADADCQSSTCSPDTHLCVAAPGISNPKVSGGCAVSAPGNANRCDGIGALAIAGFVAGARTRRARRRGSRGGSGRPCHEKRP
jgi:hypothetical protein